MEQTQFEPIKVIIADDHHVVREGFKSSLKEMQGIHLVAEATNGEELLELVDKHLPDIVITDIVMPRLLGVEATKRIKARYPYIRIIAISNFDDQDLIVNIMTIGADAFLVKTAPLHDLAEAIKAVRQGKKFFCATSATKIAEHIQEDKRQDPIILLTKREGELLVYVARGLSNKEIASKLSLSTRTIESHRLSLLQKLGLKTPIAVALYALKHKYIDLDDFKVR